MARHRDLPDSEEQETKLPTLKAVMSDPDDFLATTLDRQVQTEALHNGDPGPRLAMWSTRDPVAVLGAVRSASGWDEVSRRFGWLGSGFSACTFYRFELMRDSVPDLAAAYPYQAAAIVTSDSSSASRICTVRE
jgi:hypothetical protein